MYLNKKKYISSSNRGNLDISGVEGINPEKVKEITEEVGYWRKANAIHGWFVDNVQKGNDDCK